MPRTTTLRNGLALKPLAVLGVFAVVISGCGGSPGNATTTETKGSTSRTTDDKPIAGTFDVNGHELYLECAGQGEPTMVLEVGEARTRVDLAKIQDAYASHMRVCSYDRANKGQSGRAPTPRTGSALVSDLHGLLKAADVPGPYLLVGHSAGGLLVLAYAATHPEDVAGVVALNPVAPWKPWMAAADTLMSRAERNDEVAFLTGTNGESLDYRDVSRQLARLPAPQQVPLRIVASTVAQCPQPDSLCTRMAPTYQRILKDLSQQWAEGRFTAVEASHDIAFDDFDAVTAAIDSVLASAKNS